MPRDRMTAAERRAFLEPYRDHINAVVDNAPPLTAEAVDLLRRLNFPRVAADVEDVAS